MSDDHSGAGPFEMILSQLLHVTLIPVTRLLGASDVPTLQATVQNTAPHSITVLTYNSLLDNAAGVLGIFHLIDSSTGEEGPSDVVQFRKVWPPTRDAFAEIAPNESIKVEIPLRTHKLEAGKKYDVTARWAWQGLWKENVDVAMEQCSNVDTAEWSQNSPTTEVKVEGAFEVKQ
jgi:hypothetical protein